MHQPQRQPLVFPQPANHARAFPLFPIHNSTYATRCINEACQSASHPYSRRCRYLARLIYLPTVPSGLCIGLSYTDNHLSQLTLAYLPTSLQDPTHLDQHKHKHEHSHPYPSSNTDTRRKNSIVLQPDLQASRQQTCTSPLVLPCWLHALPSPCKLCR